MSVDEKLGLAGRRKELGNKFFKAQKWRRALKKYKDAAQVIDYEVRRQAYPSDPCLHLHYSRHALHLRYKPSSHGCVRYYCSSLHGCSTRMMSALQHIVLW